MADSSTSYHDILREENRLAKALAGAHFDSTHVDFRGNALPEPTPFYVDRAQALWEARGPAWAIPCTPGEDAYVRQVWSLLPGSACWMDAFFRIRDGKVRAVRVYERNAAGVGLALARTTEDTRHADGSVKVPSGAVGRVASLDQGLATLDFDRPENDGLAIALDGGGRRTQTVPVLHIAYVTVPEVD